jgi:hypothetical protein
MYQDENRYSQYPVNDELNSGAVVLAIGAAMSGFILGAAVMYLLCSSGIITP